MPQWITWDVGPVLGKLHREAMIGTPVETGNESLDHETGYQVQAGEARDNVGL